MGLAAPPPRRGVLLEIAMQPFESYCDPPPYLGYWTCWVCHQMIGPDDRVIVRRNNNHRHEQCGGEPKPDRPLGAKPTPEEIAERNARRGSGGGRGRRVIRDPRGL